MQRRCGQVFLMILLSTRGWMIVRLDELINFRKDLLFHGAVQLGWFTREKSIAEKAASHYIFHGPSYYGATTGKKEDYESQLKDTASFTKEVLERLTGRIADEPFTIAVAGYGTGKSHLALTLATMISKPKAEATSKILDNLLRVDREIGEQVSKIIDSIKEKPYLVVTLNGMEDFDLANEISRQILLRLEEAEIDTTVLENLRPRFKTAQNFVESFSESLTEDFQQYFGTSYCIQDIIQKLKVQDEEVFKKVNQIYTKRIGTSISAVGQESLQDFIRVVKEFYCGPKKPFGGLMIIFDEFGRYLEFAVQKPHIAGPAALQQLFEAVQENSDSVFLLSFIQYELKAYISRVAPERQEDITRYVTRYDGVLKVRLSTNLETVIASLLEKKNIEAILKSISCYDIKLERIQTLLIKWFPEIKNYTLWSDIEKFKKVIVEGCWPFHPASIWVLYKLASVGKWLQQRSVLTLLAEVIEAYKEMIFTEGQTIRPVEIFTENLLDEFLMSEKYSAQGSAALAYQTVLDKYKYQFSEYDRAILKAVVLIRKLGINAENTEDYLEALSMFCGIDRNKAVEHINSLEKEYGVLEWNAMMCQYEIIGDAVPRRAFLTELDTRVKRVDQQRREQIFANNCMKWIDIDEYSTEFGNENKIYTREWNYKIYFTDVTLLKSKIQYALRTWKDAMAVNEAKGQLIYCYLGPESQLEFIKEKTVEIIKTSMQQLDLDWNNGASLAVVLLNDSEGDFGEKMAEYWILDQELNEEERKKFANFIPERRDILLRNIKIQFDEMEKEGNIVFATDKVIEAGRKKKVLERLFDVIYPKRLPFPFDGFSTARGNAARDCQVFTRELLSGDLDRDWLTARNEQQRNRGHAVLDEAWGIFEIDGSVRMLPASEKIREIFDAFESRLRIEEGTGTNKGLNLGEAVKTLIAPPFGCNIASAGLLMALFIGRRKQELELYKDGQIVDIKNWLATAMPGNFFDISVLEATEVIRISEESVSEWERLLEEWGLERTHLGKKKFFQKAEELKERVPIPQQLHFRYRLLEKETKESIVMLNQWNTNVEDALEKIERGERKEDVSLLSWGASILADEYSSMKVNKGCWTTEQIKETKMYLLKAYKETKRCFPSWLRNQSVNDIERLSKFKHHMINNIGRNLEEIGLEEEKRLLEQHVNVVETNVRFIAEIRETVAKVSRFISENIVSSTTSVVVLKKWAEEAEALIVVLERGLGRTELVRSELEKAIEKLKQFHQSCQYQIHEHSIRAANIYEHRQIMNATDITYWREEAASLIRVFEGQEKDIEDLKLVLRQLELTEKHYNALNDLELIDAELISLLEKCKKELKEAFEDDVPPLDSELIYEDIMKSIREQRSAIAKEWIEKIITETEKIKNSNAQQVLEIKRYLMNGPSVLNVAQRDLVNRWIEACESRLDELEVEGLYAKFNELSEKNKRIFLNKLADYFNIKL